MPENDRVLIVDAWRGVAIILMMIYHFIFDLNFFAIVPVSMVALLDLQSPQMLLLQRITGFSFVFIAGVSMVLSESRNTEGYLHHFKRALFLGVIALGITLATWIYPHEGFIEFGVIHLLAVSTALAPFFFKLDYKLNLAIGAVIVLIGIAITPIHIQNGSLFWLGLTSPTYVALDHYPLLPWFGVVLLGVAAATWVIKSKFIERLKAIKCPDFLVYTGRKTLIIYLVHQLIFVGAILAFLMFFPRP